MRKTICILLALFCLTLAACQPAVTEPPEEPIYNEALELYMNQWDHWLLRTRLLDRGVIHERMRDAPKEWYYHGQPVDEMLSILHADGASMKRMSGRVDDLLYVDTSSEWDDESKEQIFRAHWNIHYHFEGLTLLRDVRIGDSMADVQEKLGIAAHIPTQVYEKITLARTEERSFAVIPELVDGHIVGWSWTYQKKIGENTTKTVSLYFAKQEEETLAKAKLVSLDLGMRDVTSYGTK